MLSIVVIAYNMRREAKRTLVSLTSGYQRDVSDVDYEVIAIDNGSSRPLDREFVTGLGPNFRYYFYETTSVSPAKAVNIGIDLAMGEDIAVIVDGARMATPGLIGATCGALRSCDQPFVCALSWHLGHDVQNILVENGYDSADEDRLLESIDWPDDGYRLFDISTLAPSSNNGFLGGMPCECSWFAMRKADYLDMGGVDERYQTPGGGLVNLDFLNRIITSGKFSPIILLGEGVFHQVHGGVSTNVAQSAHPFAVFQDEHMRIHGSRFSATMPPMVTYFGTMHPAAHRFIAQPKTGDKAE